MDREVLLCRAWKQRTPLQTTADWVRRNSGFWMTGTRSFRMFCLAWFFLILCRDAEHCLIFLYKETIQYRWKSCWWSRRRRLMVLFFVRPPLLIPFTIVYTIWSISPPPSPSHLRFLTSQLTTSVLIRSYWYHIMIKKCPEIFLLISAVYFWASQIF